MFGADFVKKLKKTTISVNCFNSAQRCTELWRTATKEQKETVEELSGCTASTIRSGCGAGAVSAKMALAFAQVFEVAPPYLLGYDDDAEYDEGAVREWLKDIGYGKLLNEWERQAESDRTDYDRSEQEALANIAERTKLDSERAELEKEREELEAWRTALESEQDELATTLAEIDLDSDGDSVFDTYTDEEIATLLGSLKILCGHGMTKALRQAALIRAILTA